MKIDLKKPIVSSIVSIVITFLMSMMVLSITKPSYIIEVSKEGKKKINIYLLFTYSMLFSFLIGICILFWRTTEISRIKNDSILSFNYKSYKPNIST